MYQVGNVTAQEMKQTVRVVIETIFVNKLNDIFSGVVIKTKELFASKIIQLCTAMFNLSVIPSRYFRRKAPFQTNTK